MPTKKDTFTATYKGPIEAMQGITMEVPHSVPNPAAWMESVWREEQAAQAAAEEKRQRQQKVLNDRIQQQQQQETLLPTEQLQGLEQRVKELEALRLPTSKDLLDTQAGIISGHNSLTKASLQLTEQARAQEEFVSKNTAQRQQIEELMEQDAKLLEQVRARHKNGLAMWNAQQEAAQAALTTEQERNAELLTHIKLQENRLAKVIAERDELFSMNEDLKAAYRKEKQKTSGFVGRQSR